VVCHGGEDGAIERNHDVDTIRRADEEEVQSTHEEEFDRSWMD